MYNPSNPSEQNDSNALNETEQMLGNVAHEATSQALKQTATVAASGAGDAALAASGVGTPIAIAKKALEVGIQAFKAVENTVTDEKQNKSSVSGIILIVFIVSFFFYIPTSIATIHGTVGASSELYHEEQYGKKMSGLFGDTSFGIRSFFLRFFSIEDNIEDYENYKPLDKSLDKNIEILNAAFETAYEIAKIEVEEEIHAKNYDYDLTMESFYENPYPFEFENINYAELLSIVSQKDTYNIENVTLRDFKRLFQPSVTNEQLKYLYCMDITEATTTITETYELNGSLFTEEKEVTYGQVTLLKYDLCSIYTMLSLDPNEFNAHYSEKRNIEILEDQEKNIRYVSNGYILGSESRTVFDCGIGRKGIFDTESYKDYLELLKTLNIGDINEAQKQLLEAAISKLGTTYSQEYRNKEGYFDCSSFVAWVYRETLGVTFGSTSPVAANICKYLEQSGCQISTKVNYNNLQVGDLVFYSGDINDRYKNITHVAFYAGDGKIIDASSSKGQVVYRDLWGANQVVSVCRPLSGQTFED